MPAINARSQPDHHGLDDEDHDFVQACDDQAGWVDDRVREDHESWAELADEVSAPPLAAPRSVASRVLVDPAPSCNAPGQRVELALGCVGRFVRIGSSQVHASHSLRFTSQYVWCSSCAGFTSGRHAKILHERCLADAHRRKYVRNRLSRGLSPQPGQPALDDDARGRILVCLTEDGALLSATQVPD